MSIKLLFFPLSIMLSLVILVWFAKPEWNAVNVTKANLAAAQEQLSQVDDQVSALERALVEYNSHLADKQLIMNAIPDQSKPDDVMAEVYQKVKDCEVLLTAMNSSVNSSAACVAANSLVDNQPSASSDVFGIQVDANTSSQNLCLSKGNLRFEILGSYNNVRKFIDEVSRMNRYAEITELSMGRSSQDMADSLTVEFSLDVFHKPIDSNMKLMNNLNKPAGQVLLSGKIESDVIEKFKTSITTRQYVPVEVGTTGKQNLFQGGASPLSAAPTPAVTTTATPSLP